MHEADKVGDSGSGIMRVGRAEETEATPAVSRAKERGSMMMNFGNNSSFIYRDFSCGWGAVTEIDQLCQKANSGIFLF